MGGPRGCRPGTTNWWGPQGPTVILFDGSLSQGTKSLAIELKTHARDARGCIPIGDYRVVGIIGRYEESSSNLGNLRLAEGLIVGTRMLCLENVDPY